MRLSCVLEALARTPGTFRVATSSAGATRLAMAEEATKMCGDDVGLMDVATLQAFNAPASVD